MVLIIGAEHSFRRGRKVYEPPRFMSIKQCIEQLLEVEEKRKEGGASLPPPHSRNDEAGG
jgi:diphthamide biosynthesis methyltransferase